MKFSEKIVRLRKIRDITQDEFAKAVGVSRQAVYKWESGQSYPEAEKLVEIKLLFNISIDNLLDDTYEVPLPDKKKKKRISAAARLQIERSVEKQLEEERAPAEEAKPMTLEIPVTDEPEKQGPSLGEVKPEEEITPEIVTAAEPAPAEEEAAEKPEAQEPKAETAPEEEAQPEKKRGFFAKLFGRK